jgi:hypothetical protein
MPMMRWGTTLAWFSVASCAIGEPDDAAWHHCKRLNSDCASLSIGIPGSAFFHRAKSF